MEEPLNVESCLKKANEYLALAQGTSDDTLRAEFLKMADELMKLARTLSDEQNSP
jgi:hypothetical protein